MVYGVVKSCIGDSISGGGGVLIGTVQVLVVVSSLFFDHDSLLQVVIVEAEAAPEFYEEHDNEEGHHDGPVEVREGVRAAVEFLGARQTRAILCELKAKVANHLCGILSDEVDQLGDDECDCGATVDQEQHPSVLDLDARHYEHDQNCHGAGKTEVLPEQGSEDQGEHLIDCDENNSKRDAKAATAFEGATVVLARRQTHFYIFP